MERLIRQYEGWEDATAADLLAWMGETTTELVAVRKNANELMILLGTEVANQLAAALEEAGLKLVVYSLASPNGINFGDPETQRMLTALGQNPAFNGHAETLKALGQDTRTRWARVYGDEPPPDEAAVALARQQMLSADWRDSTLLPLVNAAINEGKTVEQIKTALAEVE